jgi:hypothetical protein
LGLPPGLTAGCVIKVAENTIVVKITSIRKVLTLGNPSYYKHFLV